MNSKQRYWLAITLIIIAAAAGGLWVAVSGWPPLIIRDRQYQELVGDFHRARRIEKAGRGGENGAWEFQIQVPERQTIAWVRVPSPIGVVSVKYDDDAEARSLYRSVDYTTPVEIRTKENILYVRWVETLLRRNHWILAYDLAGRREIAKRRIDPNDQP